MPNTQKPQSTWYHDKGLLSVHSIFLTIQGEGPFAGQRAVFVRLAGCNLQCPLCDTEYTNDAMQMMPPAVLERVDAFRGQVGVTLVVITGGEPLRQNVVPLISSLLNADYYVQIETNGMFWLPNLALLDQTRLTIVCSPKTSKINSDLANRADAFKYVVVAGEVSPDDGLPLRALEHPASPRVARPPARSRASIYVQPADSHNAEDNISNLQQAVSSSLQFGHALSLQIHKLAELA